MMEICKASALWLKALNKDNITRIMYIEMENVIDKGSSTTMQKRHCTHTYHPSVFVNTFHVYSRLKLNRWWVAWIFLSTMHL